MSFTVDMNEGDRGEARADRRFIRAGRAGRAGRVGRDPFAVVAVVVIWALGAAACAGANEPPQAAGPVEFPAEILASLSSDAGRFVVTVRTSPQPPERGVDAVQLRVTDVAGQPVDALAIEAVPWMPAHGHGTSLHAAVEARGDGVYEVTNVYLYMAGLWELRSTLRLAADDSDTVTPVFDVR